MLVLVLVQVTLQPTLATMPGSLRTHRARRPCPPSPMALCCAAVCVALLPLGGLPSYLIDRCRRHLPRGAAHTLRKKVKAGKAFRRKGPDAGQVYTGRNYGGPPLVLLVLLVLLARRPVWWTLLVDAGRQGCGCHWWPADTGRATCCPACAAEMLQPPAPTSAPTHPQPPTHSTPHPPHPPHPTLIARAGPQFCRACAAAGVQVSTIGGHRKICPNK